MKSRFSKHVALVSLASGLVAASWTPLARACAAEPLVASVCVMAFNPGVRFQSMNQSYILAAGQTLPLNQYAALYSLLGITFGGDGRTNFNVPDLRGKVIVGYDPRDATRAVGATGGKTIVNLTVAQLPSHAMTITAQPVVLNSTTVNVTLPALTGNADLSNLSASGGAGGLKLISVPTVSGQQDPSGRFLGKGNAAAGANYVDSTTAAPKVAMAPGSIDGTVTVSFAAGSKAPVAIPSTTASATLGGSGATAGSVSGVTNAIGTGADVPVMPPYLVLPYYIAYTGIYPSSGD